MHFGKQLKLLAYPPWKGAYIDFRALKHLLETTCDALHSQGRSSTRPKKKPSAEPTPPTPKTSTSLPTPTDPKQPPDNGKLGDLELVIVDCTGDPSSESESTEAVETEEVFTLTAEAEVALLEALQSERDRVADFFKERAEECLGETLAILREAHERKESGLPLLPLKKRFYDALLICEELRDFSKVNIIGFVKILKKIARRTNFAGRVEWLVSMQQAHFVSMIPSVEALSQRIVASYVEVFRDPKSPGQDNKLRQEIVQSVASSRSWKLNSLLAQVDDHLSKARVVERKKPVAVIPIAAALVSLAALMWAPLLGKDNMPAERCLAVLACSTILWVSECFPLFVTAIIVVVLVGCSSVLLGNDGEPLGTTAAVSEVFKRLYPTSVPLMLAGFSISKAFSKYGVDMLIARRLLGSRVLRTPRRFLFASMFLCFFLSMWISNIAASVLTLTVIMPVVRDLPRDSQYRKALLIATSIGGNSLLTLFIFTHFFQPTNHRLLTTVAAVGGMTTQIASPQNAVTVDLGANSIDFVKFIAASLPIWPYLLLGGLGILLLVYKMDVSALPGIEQPSSEKASLSALAGIGGSSKSTAASIEAARRASLDGRASIAALSFEETRRTSLDGAALNRRNIAIAAEAARTERRQKEAMKLSNRVRNVPWKRVIVVFIFVVSIALWIASSWLTVFGSNIGLISMVPLALFFGTGLLDKADFESLPWALAMLLSGGNVLGYAVESSKLLALIAGVIEMLPPNLFLLSLVTNLVMILASTFISSTVAALILLNLAARVGASVGHPRVLIMTACITCSGAMGLPISCFPNINAASVENEDGQSILKSRDFFIVGGLFTALTLSGSLSIVYGVSLGLGF